MYKNPKALCFNIFFKNIVTFYIYIKKLKNVFNNTIILVCYMCELIKKKNIN